VAPRGWLRSAQRQVRSHIMSGMSSGYVPISVPQHTRQQLASKVQTRIPKHSTLAWIRAAAICSQAVRHVSCAACRCGSEPTSSAQHTRQQLAYKVQTRIPMHSTLAWFRAAICSKGSVPKLLGGMCSGGVPRWGNCLRERQQHVCRVKALIHAFKNGDCPPAESP